MSFATFCTHGAHASAGPKSAICAFLVGAQALLPISSTVARWEKSGPTTRDAPPVVNQSSYLSGHAPSYKQNIWRATRPRGREQRWIVNRHVCGRDGARCCKSDAIGLTSRTHNSTTGVPRSIDNADPGTSGAVVVASHRRKLGKLRYGSEGLGTAVTGTTADSAAQKRQKIRMDPHDHFCYLPG